jgi:murein DD-endopeptidase MepM/ murein hydrolase activator NlpD
MILPLSNIEYLVINKNGDNYHSKINKRKMNSHIHYLTAVVYGSLYTTAKRNNIPVSLIQQMNEIFNSQINFARDGRQGDYFTIMYNAYYIDDKLVTTGDIQAVSYNNHGKLYQAVRYENKSGDAQYYTPQGLSLKKAFSRYPIRFSHISSSFSLSRYHPLLRYSRPHRGVDLAASIGTPIHATGNGVISMIGRQNGYGNMIKIKHDNTYETLYGHMLKFQKGISRGSHVKRGDVIGYVGQSGLASGPHCHYEVHVRNQARNPTTVDLPRDSSVSRKETARFKQTTNPLLAHLKLFEASELASRNNKHNKLES